MGKVKFELNIDEIIEGEAYIGNDNKVFKNPEAAGKTFLFVDKLLGIMQAAFCKEAASDDNKYARVEFFSIPQNAVIIDEEEKDIKNEALMAHIQDCCDKVCKTIQEITNEHDNHIATFIGQELDAIKSEGVSNNGISEKTLLDALKIVSKQTE